MKDGMTYAFDGNGEITKAEDSNGNYLIYQYDEKGRLYKVVSNLNKELVFTYYENGEQEDLLKKIDLADGTRLFIHMLKGNLRMFLTKTAEKQLLWIRHMLMEVMGR